MTAVLISSELLFASRILDAATRTGVDLVRIDDPTEMPLAASVELVLVDWSARRPDWAERLASWRAGAPGSSRPRVILFGPHTDLKAHADARASGFGPMWARSKLVAELPALLR